MSDNREQGKRSENQKHPYGAAAGATMFFGPWDERRPDEIGDLKEYTLCFPVHNEHHGNWTSFYMEVRSPNGSVDHFWLVRDRIHKTWVGNYPERRSPRPSHRPGIRR
jgi:hypothetical protein